MKFNTDGTGKTTLHPEGTWDAVVVAQEVKNTATGRPMIVLGWKTSQGRLKTYHTWVDEHPFIFLNPMYDIGLTKEYFETEPEMEEVALELLKRRAILDVEHGDYKGNPVANVIGYAQVPDNGIKKDKPAPKAPEPDADEPF